MKPLVCFLLIISTVYTHQENGIKFEKGLSWKLLLEKAKRENKYIFVDCYATWCGPCKMMDKLIYPSEKVGAFFNSRFISVKVQMDSTKNDSEQVQLWYKDASNILKDYKITAFPTYLFFSPDGKVLHKDVGVHSEEQFLSLAQDVFDPNKQYYRMLTEYHRGKRDSAAMKKLALQEKKEGNIELALQIADNYLNIIQDKNPFTLDDLGFMYEFNKSKKTQQILINYKINYLDKLDDSSLLKQENIVFWGMFPMLINSHDKIFRILYAQPNKIDKITKKGTTDYLVRYVIRREEIEPKVWKNRELISVNPDWEYMRNTISKKYNEEYATSLVQNEQLIFYKYNGDWLAFTALRDKIIRDLLSQANNGILDDNEIWQLNVDAWHVFLKSNDRNILEKGLVWVDLAIKLSGSNLNIQLWDTRANLLYKLGRVAEAIDQEQKALEADTDSAKKMGLEKGGLFDEYTKVISDMKTGNPTYLNQGAIWNIEKLPSRR